MSWKFFNANFNDLFKIKTTECYIQEKRYLTPEERCGGVNFVVLLSVSQDALL